MEKRERNVQQREKDVEEREKNVLERETNVCKREKDVADREEKVNKREMEMNFRDEVNKREKSHTRTDSSDRHGVVETDNNVDRISQEEENKTKSTTPK